MPLGASTPAAMYLYRNGRSLSRTWHCLWDGLLASPQRPSTLVPSLSVPSTSGQSSCISQYLVAFSLLSVGKT